MTLLDLLATDLLGRLAETSDEAPRRVLLWLDPEAQFRRLVDQLEPFLLARGAQLLRYDLEAGQGQVALKLALLRLGSSDERAVVYLPGFGRAALEARPDGGPPALWGVYEFRFVGRVWGLVAVPPSEVPEPPTLLAWLKRHGLQVADAATTHRLTRGGADSLLARYAERRREESPEHWPRPLRHSDVLEALAGDPRDALRRLLAAPKNEVARWGVERPLVLERIAAEYGLNLRQGDGVADGGKPTGGQGGSPKAKETSSRLEHAPPPPPDPEELADRLVIRLALAEAWDAFGRPSDFPFLARLPEGEEHRRRSVRFLREDVLGHTGLGPSFLRRIDRLEPGYNLASWAATRDGQPAALPLLARTRWRRFLERFDTAADRSWREAGDLLLAERDGVRAGLGASWDRVDGETFWFVLADLADLIERAKAASAEAATLGPARALVDAYAERWWVVDRLHLRVRAACARVAGLERVRRVADLACFEYAAAVNQRFGDLVEADAWPPSGCRGVERLRTALWSAAGGRQAVIISDACRWDLAQCLREKLPYDCELAPVLTTLPTTTPFGMTALLPLGEGALTVEFRAQGLSIKQGNSQSLATRDGRKAFLQAALPDRAGTSRVGFVDLDDLLRGQAVPGTPLVVVFDNTVDEQGHKGTEELPGLVEPFVGNLKRTIDRLHEAGIGAVHLVTDHGFLLLPPDAVDDLGQPQALPAQTLVKDERWAALKPNAPVSELIIRSLPLAPDVTLGFARGVRTLIKAPGFLHGGISLQECVIPHLVSRTSLPRVRVGLDLRVTTDTLSVGTVPVILRPSIDRAQPPLGGLEPITVRLWVETAPAEGVSTDRVTDLIDVELRPDVEELRPPVYLKEGLDLRAGQGLLLRTLDAENGQDLGSVALTLLVDWD